MHIFAPKNKKLHKIDVTLKFTGTKSVYFYTTIKAVTRN